MGIIDMGDNLIGRMCMFRDMNSGFGILFSKDIICRPEYPL